jgi:hypothetical protein
MRVKSDWIRYEVSSLRVKEVNNQCDVCKMKLVVSFFFFLIFLYVYKYFFIVIVTVCRMYSY